MPQIPSFRASRIALALAWAWSTSTSLAAGLGEAELHSYIGSPLRVEIPLRLAAGETIDDHCISLVPMAAGSDQNALPMTLQVIHGDRNRLLIQSQRNAIEPYAMIRVRMDCAGAALLRDYALLLDPPPSGTIATNVPATPPDARSFALVSEAPTGVAMSAPAADAVAAASPGASTSRRPAPAGQTRSASARLKLESGLSMARRAASGAGGTGAPVLRLDLHMAAPPAVTPALAAQRAQLRDLRALMLSGDDTLDRLLTLQAQVGTLETQLKGLQGGTGAAPAIPAPGPLASPPPAGPGAEPVVTGGSGASAPPVPGATGIDPGAPPPPKFTVAVRKPPPPPPPAPDFDWTLPAAGSALLLLAAGGLWYARRRRAGTLEDLESSANEPDDSQDAGVVTPAPRGSRPADRRPVQTAAAAGSAEEDARAAYLAERFPEIAAGLIDLGDADSAVNGARLYAETGDHDRAEELLEAAIQAAGGQDVRPWLGLFEVHRLRNHADSYSALLARFRARFADSRYLPEILAVGRQIDASRSEFAPPPGSDGAPEVSADGTTWLNPELDFVPQALARDLHDTLMSELEDDEITLAPMGDKRP